MYLFQHFYFYLGVDQYQEAYLTATETVPVTDVRLPTHAIPEKYVIHLTPFIIPDNFTIEGHVSIDIDVNEDANNITLHIKGQEISERNCGVSYIFPNFISSRYLKSG